MDVRTALDGLGLEPDDVTALVNRRQFSVGMLDVDETPPTSLAAQRLQLAIVASEERRFGNIMLILLDAIEPELELLSPYDKARFWHLRGLFASRDERSVYLAMRALNTSMELLVKEPGGRARSYTARVHDAFGQLLHSHGMLFDAERELLAALELRGDDQFGRAITHGNLGRLYMDLGDYAKAALQFELDRKLLEQMSTKPRVLAQLHSHIGDCRLQLGAHDDARQHFSTSAKLGESDQVSSSFALVGLGKVALAQGDLEGARRFGSELEVRVPPDAPPGLFAAVSRLEGDTHLAAGRYDRALQSYDAVLEMLNGMGNASPMEYAEVFRNIARALVEKNQNVEAARNLRMALRHLDGSAAHAMQREVELQLQRLSRDSWLLHAAGRFIGQHHIERVLDSAGTTKDQAERKSAVLFSDIRGFTSLVEEKGADAVVKFLNEYLTHMTACIERHDGTIDKFIGDGIMASFPIDDDGRTKAVAAALAMKEELIRLNRFQTELGPLSIGVGIHAGKVVAGLMGSAQKREFTMIGDVVNTAARLESMTKRLGASTLVTDALNLDNEQFLIRPLGMYAPKGKAKPIGVYDVVGARDQTPESRAMLDEIHRVHEALECLDRLTFARAKTQFAELAAQYASTPRGAGYAFLAEQAKRYADEPQTWTGAISLTDK